MNLMLRGLQRCTAIDGLAETDNTRVVRAGLLMALLAMLVRVAFWGYTGRCWEDALIACLHAENAARGLGLTLVHAGEGPVQGFSSPLGVLIPLLAELVHLGWGIHLLRLLSIVAGGLAVLYALGLGIHPRVKLPAPLVLLVMGYLAFEHHQISFAMSGMESQFAVLALLMSLYFLAAWKPIPLGLSLGLCMLVRPDYCLWALIAGVYVLFRAPRHFLKVAGIALALYLPWVVFTTLYYGSPVPNTIVAKALGYAPWWEKAGGVSFSAVKRQLWMTLAEHLHVSLGPGFAGHGAGIHVFFGGPESYIGNGMFVLAVLGGLVVLFRRQWRLCPVLGYTIVYSLYYAFLVPAVFPWYRVPYVVLVLLLSVRGLQALPLIPYPRLRSAFLGIFAIVYIGLFIAVLPITIHTERQIQRCIEIPVRKAAGLYLAERIAPGETAGTEAMGYFSYYSRADVLDWPGLASRRVTAWSREHPEARSLEGMLRAFEPDYLFLRDLEVLYWFKGPTWLERHYHVTAIFEADPESTGNIRWIDRNTDRIYRIYRKNRPEDPRPYDTSLWPRRSDSPPVP